MTTQAIIAIIIVINITAFLLMAYDKAISMQRGSPRRIPEKTFFYFAFAFGAIGIYLGMLTLRHKTRKWYFQIGIPLFILGNFSALYLFHDFYHGTIWN
jgi:uncharacterized membrane protein YsdA (DUF1294 family)